MKRIVNSDVDIKLESKLVYLQNFDAKFYTVNPQSFFIRKTQDDVFTAETCTDVVDYYIKLDWSDLVTMGKGVLQYQITNNIPDEDRADLEYNSFLERTTEYYVYSDVTVDPETESSITEVIAELEEKIDAEITRSTSADTVHEVAIQDEVITRQQNVSGLTDLITGETNRAISAETAIDDKFDNVYTKSEVYNKSEIDTIIENIDVSDQLVNYTPLSSFTSFSGEVTFQYNALNDKINQEVLDRELIDTSLDRRINNKLDASAYTPTDLTSYYTKSETDNLVNAETTRATNAESALNTSIESKYEKPSGGIPKSDLASSVQSSLDKADTALQEDTLYEDANGHDYVEIAGMKWATMNVGANAVTDTGLYFQWGDTQGYTAEQVGVDKDFTWDDYKWTNDGGTTMTKYNDTDGKTVLDLEDDAAHANMGGTWRMPTTEEMQAFGNAVNAVWTNDYQNSGVAGLVCTDKTDNTKVVFFPASGRCRNGELREVGSRGCNWCGEIDFFETERGYRLLFDSLTTVFYEEGYSITIRCVGIPIRAILDKSQLKKDLDSKANDADLATVAKSGNYNDLTNKPSIPSALSQLSEDSTHRVVSDAEKTTWNNKQDTLVSGTNIKTINNQSIIGSGNIEIQGGGSFDPTQYYTKQETDDLLAAIEMGQIGYIDAGDYA